MNQRAQSRFLDQTPWIRTFIVYCILSVPYTPRKERHFSQALQYTMHNSNNMSIVLMLINSLKDPCISQMNIFYSVTFHSFYFSNIQVVSINFTYILFRFEKFLRFIARMILSSHDGSPDFYKPVFCSAKFPGLQAVFSRANKIYLILQIRRINFPVDF